MKSKRNILKNFARLFLVSILLISEFSLISCSSPQKLLAEDYKFTQDTSASWDGGKQNSGILRYDKINGFEITDGAAQRYTDLTIKYGKNNIPKLTPGQGIIVIDNKKYLPNEYMVIFALLNQKNKRGDL
jgi:hypothetical protein